MPFINSLRIGKCIIHRAKEDKENHDDMESIFSFKSKLKIRFKIGFEFQEYFKLGNSLKLKKVCLAAVNSAKRKIDSINVLEMWNMI